MFKVRAMRGFTCGKSNDKGTNLSRHRIFLFLLFYCLVWPVSARSASASVESFCREKSKLFSFKIPFSRAVSVFKRDGSRQCEEGTGTPAKEMAKELKSAGIRVLKSAKGHLPKGRGMALCGAPTHNINIFYISPKHEKKALEKGFQACKSGESGKKAQKTGPKQAFLAP